MAGRAVPKVKVNKKKFESMLANFDLTYKELGEMSDIDRTGSAMWKNVNDGEMPIYTALAIAMVLDVDIGTFAPNAIREKEIRGFVKLLTPKQKSKLYSLLEKEFMEV